MIRLFDPQGIEAKDYLSTYPELKRTPEFEHFRGVELIFIWYYANQTSPFIGITDKATRVEEALKRSEFIPNSIEHAKILKLEFSERQEMAIGKMASFIPGARYFGWKSLKSIFDNYQEIAQMSPSDFTKATKAKSGEEESVLEAETDYKAYVDITKSVVAAMPTLITKLEEGFGISATGDSEADEEGSSRLGEWMLNKQNKSM